jgi:hypothetical protein
MWWTSATPPLYIHFIHYAKSVQELQLLIQRQLIPNTLYVNAMCCCQVTVNAQDTQTVGIV